MGSRKRRKHFLFYWWQFFLDVWCFARSFTRWRVDYCRWYSR